MFYWIVVVLSRIVFTPFLWLKGVNKKVVPKKGRVVIASNHIKNTDPFLLMNVLHRRLTFMSKIENYSNPIFKIAFKWFGVIPVSRGEADISAIKSCMKVLKNEGVVAIFPEGTRSKTGELLEFKNGTVLIAVKTGSPIVPCYIGSNYRIFRPYPILFGELLDFEDLRKEYSGKELLTKSNERLLSAITALKVEYEERYLNKKTGKSKK